MPITGSYGLGTSVRGQGGGRGGGLAGEAVSREREAMRGLGEVAQQETERNIFNQQARSQQRQAAASGAISGATTGMTVGGPWGAAAGFVLGGLLSSSF